MPLSLRRLNRATLARQMLLARERVPTTTAVRRVVALQAQEAMSPYVALANRVEGFRPAELDAAFRDGSVVKASLMRITLHAVTAGEYPVFHRAMLDNLRASRLNDRRFTDTGMTAVEADGLVPDVVAFASSPRTRADVEEFLAERLGSPPHERLWWAMRTYAPLVHAPGDGPWTFGWEPQYLAAPAAPDPVDPESALAHLVRRYLEGFGPASVRDFAQFAMQKRSATRRALERLAGELVVLEGPGGEEYFDLPDAPLPGETMPAPPRLMAMWDSTLLAYADRGRLIPPEHRRTVIRQNGDVLPTVLVDGFVRGVWRPSNGGIEVRAFDPLTDSDWRGLAEEAGRLVSLFDGRPPTYGRYAHWWKRLPAGETRLLAGDPPAD